MLAPAIRLARLQLPVGGGTLRLLLPDVAPCEAQLLLAALYATSELHVLADSLSAPRLRELAGVAHRLNCTKVLRAVDAAMVRKCKGEVGSPSDGWLSRDNVLGALTWSRDCSLPGLQELAAQYVAAHLDELALDSAACAAGDETMMLVLKKLQRHSRDSGR